MKVHLRPGRHARSGPRLLSALGGPPETLTALAKQPSQQRGSMDLVDFAVRGWAIRAGEHPVMLGIVATAGVGSLIPPAFLNGAPRLLSVRYADGACLPMLSPNTPDPFAFRLGRLPPDDAPGEPR